MGDRISMERICITAAVLLLIGFIFSTPAGAKPGTQEDPLVTKSYVDTYIAGQMDAGANQMADLANRLEEQQKQLDSLRTKLNPFKDTKDHWALESILYLKARGIISGFEDGTFRPNGKVTRAELAAMLVRAKGIQTNPEAKPEFRDVPSGHWAYKEIAAAKAEGIISGYPDGTFGPSQPVTREQIAAMITRAFSAEPALPDQSFTDISRSWAKESIIALAKAGIIGGYPDNTFAPKRSATRAEVSIILTRAIEPSKRIKK